MSSRTLETLAPSHLSTVRPIIARAFSAPGPVPARPVPGGSLSERLAAFRTWTPDGRVTPAEEAGEEYWVRSIPHRLVVLGPLLDVGEVPSLTPPAIRGIEREMLRAYYRSYGGWPLPPVLLDLLVQQDDPILVEWLDGAVRRIMRSRSVGDAGRHRVAFRADALRQGAIEAWKESSTPIAELMADIFLLLRGARDDVDRAVTLAAQEATSVGAILRTAADAQQSTVERILSVLAEWVVTKDDFPTPEQDVLLGWAADRPEASLEISLSDEAAADPQERATGGPLLFKARGRSRIPASPIEGTAPSGLSHSTSPTVSSDPHREFRRLLEALEERILGRPQLCRDLALIGLGAVCGVQRQRVLLCGPTGSGKSHSAQALADVLGRPFLRLHIPDVTTTGFRGVEISSALEALPSTADGTLDECVLFLDEVDKARIPGSQVEGNSRAAELGLMASLMHVLDGSPVTSDSYNAEQLSTAGLLVVGAGAFENRFAHQPPSTRELEEWGWMPEFAARWTTRLVLSPPGPVEAMELLRSSQRSVRGQLGPLIDALGLSIEIPEATIRYAVHHWHRLGTDLRSASAWLAGAARREIIAALEAGGEAEIVIKPDDLEITRELWRQGPGERDLP